MPAFCAGDTSHDEIRGQADDLRIVVDVCAGKLEDGPGGRIVDLDAGAGKDVEGSGVDTLDFMRAEHFKASGLHGVWTSGSRFRSIVHYTVPPASAARLRRASDRLKRV
jgi:hypothetical protein